MSLDYIIKSQKEYFNSNVTRDVNFRKNSLEKLLESINEQESAIYAALKSDLNKSAKEVYMTEIKVVKDAIRYALRHLDSWSRDRKVSTPSALWPARSRVIKEGYGIVLIIASWNYPFRLALMPLISAIAAGNCAVIKTSKNSPETGRALKDIINSTFERKYVYAIEDQLPYQEILNQKYDYIYFTGSERAGRTVMRAAADKLIPVSLHMGGKNPCIIHESADLPLAAKRIMWGKLLNAGQSATAPDYVLVPENLRKEFADLLMVYARELVSDPFANDNYPKIVNLHQFMRLKNLIEKESTKMGGRIDDNLLKIEPTVIPDVTFDSNIMKEEIYGPVLPVISYDEIEIVLDIIKHRPEPLALYVFAKDEDFINRITHGMTYGSGCINDVMIQGMNEALPFGGVGASGIGSCQGKAGFDLFTHEKGIIGSRSSIEKGDRYISADWKRLFKNKGI